MHVSSFQHCFRGFRRFGLILAAAGVLASSSCSHDSYLVLTLASSDTQFSNVAFVIVDVQSLAGSTSTVRLTYDARKNPISIGDTPLANVLSISFTPSRTGLALLTVYVLDTSNSCVGTGFVQAPIKKGDVSPAKVNLHHTTTCFASDGGVTDGGVTFAGCDPAVSTACAANQTCFVDCSTRRGMCVMAGNRGPGEACATNADCMPGTQCFDYSAVPGCQTGTRVCLKFCSGDNQCASAPTGTGGAGGSGGGGGGAGATGSGGGAATGGGAGTAGAGGGAAGGATSSGGAGGLSGGTGGAGGSPVEALVPSACRNPVVCSPTVITTYKTCSFACDPRGAATLGCPAGLRCFLYRDSVGGQDSPDCGCQESTRTGTDGAACMSSTACAPGYVCNMMSTTQVCRKLCRMSSPGDCTAPQVCTALQNNAVFGVCIGS